MWYLTRAAAVKYTEKCRAKLKREDLNNILSEVKKACRRNKRKIQEAHVFPETIEKLKALGYEVTVCNPNDPFWLEISW